MSQRSSEQPRRLVQSRQVSVSAYSRDDRLWDSEAVLLDTKTEAVKIPERGAVPAGEPIHEMKLRVTVDAKLEIREVEASTLRAPYRACGDITLRYGELVGVRIGLGFNKRIRKLFRSTNGCVHLTELLPPIATAALQAIWWSDPRVGAQASIGGCHALRRDGDVVRIHYSDAYNPKPA